MGASLPALLRDTRVLDLDGSHLFPYELESLLHEGLAVGGDRHTHCLKPRANVDRPVVDILFDD